MAPLPGQPRLTPCRVFITKSRNTGVAGQKFEAMAFLGMHTPQENLKICKNL